MTKDILIEKAMNHLLLNHHAICTTKFMSKLIIDNPEIYINIAIVNNEYIIKRSDLPDTLKINKDLKSTIEKMGKQEYNGDFREFIEDKQEDIPSKQEEDIPSKQEEDIPSKQEEDIPSKQKVILTKNYLDEYECLYYIDHINFGIPLSDSIPKYYTDIISNKKIKTVKYVEKRFIAAGVNLTPTTVEEKLKNIECVKLMRFGFLHIIYTAAEDDYIIYAIKKGMPYLEIANDCNKLFHENKLSEGIIVRTESSIRTKHNTLKRKKLV